METGSFTVPLFLISGPVRAFSNGARSYESFLLVAAHRATGRWYRIVTSLSRTQQRRVSSARGQWVADSDFRAARMEL